MAKSNLDNLLLGGTVLLLGYGALSFLSSCMPPPETTGPDAGAGGRAPPEGVLPPLEPHMPNGEHELCACPDQACLDQWICEQSGGAAPICLSWQCSGKLFHHCTQECP